MEEVKAFASHFREQDAATVIVDGENAYRIPQSLLEKLRSRCSTFWERLTDEMVMHRSLSVDTHTDSDMFELFLFWASELRLPCFDTGKDDITIGGVPAADVECPDVVDTLADLWIFAEEFAIPKLQNEAIKRLLEVLIEVDVRPSTLSLFNRFRDEAILQSVLLLEVAHGLWCDCYTSEEVDELAKVEGFLERFASLVRGEGSLDLKGTSPSRHFANGGDISAFMVPEE
ncbi:hypothetical protein KC318_g2590 [Hortaea werneckii]|uniref:BTB domain-containing protein n=1 Tax=Hortaea werneckii TaxID=91943 RepID=A0A3M7BD07_HORWE|nr:hypothetical protein KC334_g1980 [Hortaea werneckii]KAI7022784.1 hypothetical protein KC355_g1955 [Hortaea werneckii]KAI7672850.1 hypothetical protein KC318_g2590 [Hortaea werneckii]RMY14858.1 hypothetical protein D0867_07011 [Hortaea werneckii]RMY37631.1 hypothetical protein D0866_03135 [Hortaea werneckii]